MTIVVEINLSVNFSGSGPSFKEEIETREDVLKCMKDFWDKNVSRGMDPDNSEGFLDIIVTKHGVTYNLCCSQSFAFNKYGFGFCAPVGEDWDDDDDINKITPWRLYADLLPSDSWTLDDLLDVIFEHYED